MTRHYARKYHITYPYIQNKHTIGVLSGSWGAGSTFVASSLARHIVENHQTSVTYLEAGNSVPNLPILYEDAGMGEWFRHRKIQSVFDVLRETYTWESIRNYEFGINWAVKLPEERQEGMFFTPKEAVRAIHHIPCNWMVCDLGVCPEPYLLDEMDTLVFVMDPSPAHMDCSGTYLDHFRRQWPTIKQVVWVLNKVNPAVPIRSVQRRLKLRKPIAIPLVSHERIFDARFHCLLPYDMPAIRETIQPALEEIVSRHISITLT